MRSSRENWVTRLLELTAVGNLCIPAATVAIATIGFAVGLPLQSWMLGMAVCLAIAVVYCGCRSARTTAAVCSLVLIIHLGGLFYAGAVADESWDGLWYHQEAVLQLAAGWNPIYGDAGQLGTPPHAAFWIDHYPKAAWIAAAPWLQITGSIDSGKLYNVTMLATAVCMLITTLLRYTGLAPVLIVWIAVVAATNPVAIAQSTTYVSDGVLGCLLTILLASLIGFLAEGRPSRLWPAWLATVMLVNVKFMGPIYAVVFYVATALAAPAWQDIATVRRFCWAAGVVLLVSVCGIGYAPYVRNTLEHGSPVYPLRGSVASQVVEIDRPVNLTPHDRVSRFLISAFSRTGSVVAPKTTELKAPWSVARSELSIGENHRAGGLGPLYGAALLGGIALFVVVLASTRSRPHGLLCGVMVVIVLSMFVHGEAWWMRYVPQAWLLPCLSALAAVVATSRSVRAMGVLLLLVISANLGLVCFGFATAQRWLISNRRMYLAELRAAPKPVHVYVHAFPGFRQRLQEAGIAYVEIPPPSYTSTPKDLLERAFMPPGPYVAPSVILRGISPHNRVLWYSQDLSAESRGEETSSGTTMPGS